MKKRSLLVLAIIFCYLYGAAQDENKANDLINEGIKLHDEGKYAEAVALYKEALAVAADYPRALYEMSYTYYIAGNYDSAIFTGTRLLDIKKVPDDILRNEYVTLGSVYDENKQPDKAMKTYKEGIKKFPDFYLLYFNLGITQYLQNQNKEALANFQKALTLKPLHAGTNFGTYKILADDNKVPAVLAAAMVCIAEQNTKRSVECATFIQNALTPNVKSDSNNKNVTIYIPSSFLSNAKENNFSGAELGLSLMAVSPTDSGEIDNSLQLNTVVNKLSFQLQGLCGFLEPGKKNKGFYWKFYAPFFYDLKQNDYSDVLVNLILLNTERTSKNWISDNQTKVNAFYDWLKNYEWMKN